VDDSHAVASKHVEASVASVASAVADNAVADKAASTSEVPDVLVTVAPALAVATVVLPEAVVTVQIERTSHPIRYTQICRPLDCREKPEQ
jgi:hypothetical protein